MNRDRTQTAIIEDAIKVIEEFRKLDLEMQMQTALIFLLIAKNEGCSIRDIERWTGLSSAAASRNVAALAKYHRKGKPGHDVVTTREDPMDRRNRQIFLTPKGRSVLGSILERFRRDHLAPQG